MKRQNHLWPLPIALTVLFSSCEHQVLCIYHDDHALSYAVQLYFTYDRYWHEDYSCYNDSALSFIQGGWVADLTARYDRMMPELTPSLPEGIRGLVFDANGGYHTYNFSASEGSLRLSQGDHQMLFYNNDSEYIIFDNSESRASDITITTRTRNRSSYHGSPYINSGTRAENTVAAPDMLYYGYIDNYSALTASATPDTLTVQMSPLVCTYVIVFNFEHGGQYVTLARGALAGMAGSVKLYNGETDDEDVATVLFDCNLYSGYAQAVVNTFGVPGYQLQSEVSYITRLRSSVHTYGLNLELLLTDGTLLTFDYDVTDQVSLQPQGGVITIDGIIIDKPQGTSVSSGFDVEVNGWGEYQDYILPI